MIGVETDEIIGQLFNSLLDRHQKGLEEYIKRSDFIFDFADELHNKCYKINLNRGRSYINAPQWLTLSPRAFFFNFRKKNGNFAVLVYCAAVN